MAFSRNINKMICHVFFSYLKLSFKEKVLTSRIGVVREVIRDGHIQKHRWQESSVGNQGNGLSLACLRGWERRVSTDVGYLRCFWIRMGFVTNKSKVYLGGEVFLDKRATSSVRCVCVYVWKRTAYSLMLVKGGSGRRFPLLSDTYPN